MQYSPYQLAYIAHKLTLRGPAGSMDRISPYEDEANPYTLVSELAKHAKSTDPLVCEWQLATAAERDAAEAA